MPGETLQYRVNINPSEASECASTIKDVSYSNDGQEDLIRFYLRKGMKNDSKILTYGNFTTEAASREGHLWDVIKSSGQVGTIVKDLISGEYFLIIEVASSDDYGVELDTVLVLFACDHNECPEIPNHEPVEYSAEKQDTWKICLIAIGYVSLGMSLGCNIYTCYKCIKERYDKRRQRYVAIPMQ